MGVKAENIFTYLNGTHPNATAKNSSGAATQDGSEFIAEYINNFILGPWQALFNYASITPNGVTESAAASQWLTCIEKGYAVGPGKLVCSFLNTIPSVSGDRIILLQGQGVLIAGPYAALDAAVYVGDGNNATVAAGGGKFYRSSDSAGTTPNIAGPYLQLPEGRGYALRGLDLAASVDPLGASRFLGDNQVDAMQRITGDWKSSTSVGPVRTTGGEANGVFYKGGDSYANGVDSFSVASNNIGFDSSGSTSPNTAKTDDDETRMSNLSIQFGITY